MPRRVNGTPANPKVVPPQRGNRHHAGGMLSNPPGRPDPDDQPDPDPGPEADED